MLYSTQTATAVRRFGIKKGVKFLAEAGYPCLDISFCDYTEEIRLGQWRAIAEEYREAAELFGIKYNQGHAPYGGSFATLPL